MYYGVQYPCTLTCARETGYISNDTKQNAYTRLYKVVFIHNTLFMRKNTKEQVGEKEVMHALDSLGHSIETMIENGHRMKCTIIFLIKYSVVVTIALIVSVTANIILLSM